MSKTSASLVPDYFRGWGRAWSKADLAWYNSSYMNSSFEYLDYLKSQYSLESFEIRSKNVVIVSQGAIGNELSIEIAKRIESFKNLNVFYKLHPGEFSTYKTFSGYKTLSEQKNFTFITNGDLYDYFKKSNYIVGVFSTAVLEGVSFGMEPYLVDISGIEYMEGRLDFKMIDELFQSV